MTPVNALASLPTTQPAAKPAAQPAAPAEERDLWDRLWGKEGFSFGALLDIINPLQHIPVVSTIYRSITGDTIGPAARMAGGALFGGVVGLIASAADATVEAITGKDTGSQILAMLPEPDLRPQWTAGERRGERPQMAGLMNVPDGATQFADTDEPDREAGDGATAAGIPTAAVQAPGTAADVASSAAGAAAASAPGSAAGMASGPVANPAFPPPPRIAQMGAGGRLVPLATNGHTPGATLINLPAAQNVAADPTLLRELRQGGAATVNAAQKNSGHIDTAIKGHGIVAPRTTTGTTAGAAATGPIGAASWLDYATSDPQAMGLGAAAIRDERTNAKTPHADPSAFPEVGPDFLMKMQQALDKYQAIRNSPPPSVDLSR